MATLRKRRPSRKVTNTDFEYELGSSSEQEINASSQNTVVSEQNDSDSSYREGQEFFSEIQREQYIKLREEILFNQESESEKFIRKWKTTDPGLCCVCLDEDATKDNVLVYCDGSECDVVVHQECYGITLLPEKEDPWYCDRCIALSSEIVSCVLCPNKNGAFRKIKTTYEAKEPSVWVHILCAFWMPGMHIGTAANLRDIQVVNVDPKNWGKKCHVCNSEEGAAIHCDAGQCKNWVHATCAVAFGLTEYYCKHHGPNDHPRQNKIEKWIRKRDEFLADEYSKLSEDRITKFQDRAPGENIREIFQDTYAEYTSQRELLITDFRRRIVQQSSKHNSLIDAKEKAVKNVKDFRAKIPIVKNEHKALKSYFDKASEAVISLIPQMRDIKFETNDEAMKLETLMESITTTKNIRWTKEAKRNAKNIKINQLSTGEVKSLNIKSIIMALARAAKEEKEKARQKGRRSGFKGRGRPKAPNKVKEKEKAVGQEETPEGDEGEEQPSTKRTTRSRVASVKGKSKQIEDEGNTQKGNVPADNINAPKSPKVRSDAKRGPKRKREEEATSEDLTQKQSTDINTEDQTELSKKKRVQNLSTNAQSTDMIEGQVNTETSTVSSKKNTRKGKRKRSSDVPSDNAVEGTSSNNDNKNDQALASVKSDEVIESIPVKRQYKRTRKPANKKKSGQTSKKGTSNDQEVSSSAQDEQTSETVQSVQDSPSTTSNENMNTCVPNEPVLVTRVEPKMVFKRRRRRKVAPASPKPKPKLRPIAPKEGFPVVLNIKQKCSESEDMEYTTNEVIESTPNPCENFNISTITPEYITQQESISIINEEVSFNKRSGGLLGISNLLNPVEDSPSSTSTIYETSAQTYLYEAANASVTNQSYFGSNERLYQKPAPSTNIAITQSIGYGSITDNSVNTTSLQQNYFMAESSSKQMAFGVPLTTHASVSESRSNTFTNSFANQELNIPYSNPFIATATNYTPFHSTTQMDTRTFTSSYVPMNQNDSITTFTSPYEGTGAFNNVTSNVQAPAVNTSNINGLDALVTAAEFVERIPGSSELSPFVPEDVDEIQDKATTETSQDQSQIHDAHEDVYNESCSSVQVNSHSTVSPSSEKEVVNHYQSESADFLNFADPNTRASDMTIDNETPRSSEDHDAQNVETIVPSKGEDSKEEPTTLTQDTLEVAGTPDTVDTADTANNEEQLMPAQNTKLRRKRVPAIGGTRKKAGRKPKAKSVEEEVIQPRTPPIPQPDCTVCQLSSPPENDQPSATYIKPNRARESMLHKGRDKVNRMVRCGYCSKWYHLACMVPPRRTMPTGGYVWRCAECDHPSSVNSTSVEPSGHSASASSTKKWNLRSATK
ncbi:17985_t:CDS:2 [Funneliformis geosporum]|uniref:4302_t:CDS:1 n=1 Tax=Funneliformis geosporum TaxID=1117311 RepID=A0A9W4WVC0_9GLOM|nr:4302_t:CDS:2 [Funneliformis geosporum]CAI2181784.1 17985_t:CDS:2 [Funneliformis geosporum]